MGTGKQKVRILPGDKLVYKIGSVDSKERANIAFDVLKELLYLTKDQKMEQTSNIAETAQPLVKYKLFKKKTLGSKK